MRCACLAFALLALLAASLGRVPRPGAAQGTAVAEGGGLVAGPGLALLAEADDGSAAAASGLVGDHALVLARNGLAEPAVLRVMAAGLDRAGELVWVAEADSTLWSDRIDEGVQPGFVPAGGVAMAVLRLPDGAPAAATVKLGAIAVPEDPFFAEPEKDLGVASARLDGDRIVVEVRNLGSEVRDAAYLVAFCLEPGGGIVGLASHKADVALVEGEAATVELPLGGQPCADFVVSARDSF